MADELIEPKDPTEVLLREYEEYLVTYRRLAVASARKYVGVARRFLSCATDGKGPDLLGERRHRFELHLFGMWTEGSARTTVMGARSWLRFLYATGRTRWPSRRWYRRRQTGR